MCTVFIMIFNNIYILWIIFLAVIPAMNCEEICDSTSDNGFDYYDQTENIFCGHGDFERILDTTNSNLDSSKHCCLFGEQIGYIYKDTCKVHTYIVHLIYSMYFKNCFKVTSLNIYSYHILLRTNGYVHFQKTAIQRLKKFLIVLKVAILLMKIWMIWRKNMYQEWIWSTLTWQRMSETIVGHIFVLVLVLNLDGYPLDPNIVIAIILLRLTYWILQTILIYPDSTLRWSFSTYFFQFLFNEIKT